jgi:Cys-tRNA synthase (O-phospho-L-seryl-tRNA:Cys-tRNA synthase)
VKYCNEVFLPAMAKFEERMTKFEGSELKRVAPTLREGKKEIIPQFHDESCLTVNDYKVKAWLR